MSRVTYALDDAVAAVLADGNHPVVAAKYFDCEGIDPYALARRLGAYIWYNQPRKRYELKPGD